LYLIFEDFYFIFTYKFYFIKYIYFEIIFLICSNLHNISFFLFTQFHVCFYYLLLILINKFLSVINSLISVFFFQFSPANLGGGNPSCGRIFAFSLDSQMWISWTSDIEIKRLKKPNSSTHVGLQLSWRIQGEIKSF
jgi:hypothetical protein